MSNTLIVEQLLEEQNIEYIGRYFETTCRECFGLLKVLDDNFLLVCSECGGN